MKVYPYFIGKFSQTKIKIICFQPCQRSWGWGDSGLGSVQDLTWQWSSRPASHPDQESRHGGAEESHWNRPQTVIAGLPGPLGSSHHSWPALYPAPTGWQCRPLSGHDWITRPPALARLGSSKLPRHGSEKIWRRLTEELSLALFMSRCNITSSVFHDMFQSWMICLKWVLFYLGSREIREEPTTRTGTYMFLKRHTFFLFKWSSFWGLCWTHL